MIRMIANVFRSRLDEIKSLIIIDLIMWTLMTVMLFILTAVDDNPTSFEIGTLMIGVVSIFYIIVLGTYGFKRDFNLAVGMGATRRQFVPAYFFVTLIMEAIQLCILYVSHLVESWEIRTFLSHMEKDTGIEYILFSRYIILLIIFIAALQLFTGCSMLKFGKKAYYGVAMIWGLGCMFSSIIVRGIERGDDKMLNNIIKSIGEFIVKYASSWCLVIAGGFILLILAVTFTMVRKQQVTAE